MCKELFTSGPDTVFAASEGRLCVLLQPLELTRPHLPRAGWAAGVSPCCTPSTAQPTNPCSPRAPEAAQAPQALSVHTGALLWPGQWQSPGLFEAPDQAGRSWLWGPEGSAPAQGSALVQHRQHPDRGVHVPGGQRGSQGLIGEKLMITGGIRNVISKVCLLWWIQIIQIIQLVHFVQSADLTNLIFQRWSNGKHSSPRGHGNDWIARGRQGVETQTKFWVGKSVFPNILAHVRQ